MSVDLVGALATAGVLGATHAIEPDHVAGIASLTGRYEDARLSALVGACFSFGHVALVVGWLAVGYVVLRRTEFPAVFDTVGTLGVVALLAVLGTTLAFRGLRSALYAHSHEHEHGGETHSHVHAHLSLFGGDEHDGERRDAAREGHDDAAGHGHHDTVAGGEHDDAGGREHDHASGRDHDDARGRDGALAHEHDHDAYAYLKTGVVGALFTLSPPLSMIAFSATLFSAGPTLVVLAVVAYAVAITATMSALGAGVGAAFGGASDLNVRVYGGLQAFSGVLVAGLAASLFVGSSVVG